MSDLCPACGLRQGVHSYDCPLDPIIRDQRLNEVMTTKPETITVEELDEQKEAVLLGQNDPSGPIVIISQKEYLTLHAAARKGIEAEEIAWGLEHSNKCPIHDGGECSCGLFKLISPPQERAEPSGERCKHEVPVGCGPKAICSLCDAVLEWEDDGVYGQWIEARSNVGKAARDGRDNSELAGLNRSIIPVREPSPSPSVEGRENDWTPEYAVKRLRQGCDDADEGCGLCENAADLIERLEQERDELRPQIAQRNAYIKDLVSECNHFSKKADRLDAALRCLLEDTEKGMMFSDRISKARAALSPTQSSEGK